MKTKFVRLAASRYWALKLEGLSNVTLYQLAKMARSHLNNRDINPELTNAREGKRTPSRNLVLLFDRLVPGSGAAWRSFFWDIIENPQLSGRPLDIAIKRLPIELREIVTYLDNAGQPTKRKQIISFRQIESIARISTLDALGVLLLLAQETKAAMRSLAGAKWLENYAVYCDIVWASDFLLARLATFSPFREFANLFRDLIFNLIFQHPERTELKERIAKMHLNKLPEHSRDFTAVTQVGRLLLHYKSFDDVVFESEEDALQFLHDRLMPLSRYPIDEFEEKAYQLCGCPFAGIMYDAIFFSGTAFTLSHLQ